LNNFISYRGLSRYLTATEAEVAALAGAQRCGTDASPWYFKDNGSQVLAVAHLDYVGSASHAPQRITLKPAQGADRELIFHPALDDRLGAYIIGDVLPKYGVRVDILYTTGEETHKSSAKVFAPIKSYDWVVEFDRRGTDVVGYQYQDDDCEWSKLVRAAKMTVGNGSYTDIVDLEFMKVLCFNWGIGYHNEHTAYCHVEMLELRQQLYGFMTFYEQNVGKKLPFEPKPKKFVWYNGQHKYYGGKWNDKDDDEAPYYYGKYTASSAVPKGPAEPTTAIVKAVTGEVVPEKPAHNNGHNRRAKVKTVKQDPEKLMKQAPELDVLANQYPVDDKCDFCGERSEELYANESKNKEYLFACAKCARELFAYNIYLLGDCKFCGKWDWIRVGTINSGNPVCIYCEEGLQAVIGNA